MQLLDNERNLAQLPGQSQTYIKSINQPSTLWHNATSRDQWNWFSLICNWNLYVLRGMQSMAGEMMAGNSAQTAALYLADLSSSW